MTYKPLPEQYRKNSFDYYLIHRTERMALYMQKDADKIVAYEVCRILRHDGRTIGGKTVEPAEFLPSTEQWGSLAWTIPTLPAALIRLHEVEDRLATAPPHA